MLLRSDGNVQTFYTAATGCVREGIWQSAQRFIALNAGAVATAFG